MDATRIIRLAKAILSDRAINNRLIGLTEEYTSEECGDAVELALMHINQSGIIKFSYTVDTCPEYVLTLGVAKYLIAGKISEKARNTVVIQDDGAVVNREGNIQLYMKVSEQIAEEFANQLKYLKDNANLSSGYGY